MKCPQCNTLFDNHLTDCEFLCTNSNEYIKINNLDDWLNHMEECMCKGYDCVDKCNKNYHFHTCSYKCPFCFKNQFNDYLIKHINICGKCKKCDTEFKNYRDKISHLCIKKCELCNTIVRNDKWDRHYKRCRICKLCLHEYENKIDKKNHKCNGLAICNCGFKCPQSHYKAHIKYCDVKN